MVTGDQDRTEQGQQARITETGPVRCSCDWTTVDTGSMFYSRISKPDPDCPVHRR